MEMVNPYDGLLSLQKALDDGDLDLEHNFQQGNIHQDIYCFFDQPEGSFRLTYTKCINGKILAHAVFTTADPLNKKICFSIGYSTHIDHRGNKLAQEIVSKSIDEIALGFRDKIGAFYIEAIIDTENIASLKIAQKLLNLEGRDCTDSYSGKNARAYAKLVNADL